MTLPFQIRRALLLVAALFLSQCSSSSTNEGAGGAGAAAGTGGAGGSGTLLCGGAACNAKTEKCCFATNLLSVTGTACAEAGGKCPDALTATLTCDDAADCAAQGSPASFCCATLKPTCSDQTPEQCITGAQCSLPENCVGDAIILCDPTALGSCPEGLKCTPHAGTIRGGVCAPV